jgi:cytoskeletal protein RodZ
MDGTRLTRHAHPLPKLQAVTTTSTEKSKGRSRFVAVVATLVLAVVMAMVYFVSIRQPARRTTVAISPTVEAAQPNAAVSPASIETLSEGGDKARTESPSNRSQTTNDGPAVTESETPKPEATPSLKPDANRTIKATSQTRNTTQSSTTKPEEKDDSKVRTALKKTGRFFKKALPF